MSEEVHLEEHSSPIKTPQQLLVVIVLAFVLPVVVIGMLVALVTGGFETQTPAQSQDAVAKRLRPIGDVEVVDASIPRVEKSGKEIVDAVCAACHATGALNAPKIGDRGVWKKLIAEGLPDLTDTAIKGVGAMPPRGGDPDLSDTEVARAVVQMANEAGAGWKEPAPKPAAIVAASTAGTSTGAAPASTQAAVATSTQAPPPQAPGTAPAAPAKAQVATADSAAAGGKGKAIYDANCTVCHAAGVAGAPKVGDKAAWAPRLKAGIEAMHVNAIKGKGAMPPKGGNLALADADVRAAVEYLVSTAK